MAPKATKKGTSDTNIGRLITDLSGRVDHHLERAFEDLNKGSAERVIDRMHELEKETTREYGLRCTDALLEQEREPTKRLDIQNAAAGAVVEQMKKSASELRAEIRDLEKTVKSWVGVLLEGVKNRFERETQMSLEVIHSKVEEAMQRLSKIAKAPQGNDERGILDSALPKGTARVQSHDSINHRGRPLQFCIGQDHVIIRRSSRRRPIWQRSSCPRPSQWPD
jgi:type VI protein secretion system component VasK